MSQAGLIPVDNELLVSAISEAGAADFFEYKDEHLGWLESHSRLAHIALTGFDVGADQIPAMLGTAVGIHAVRKHIEAELISLPEVVDNHQGHYLDKKLVIDKDIEEDRLRELFGGKAGSTLAKLKHPKVRALSGLVLITSIGSDSTPETDKMIKLPSPVRRRNRDSIKITGHAK